MHPSAHSPFLIYLLHPNALLAKDTAVQMAQIGYPLTVFATLAELVSATHRQIPAVILVDLGKVSASKQLQQELLRLRQVAGFVLILLSSRGNFEARLNAVQAGADAYFIRPIDLLMVGKEIEALTRRREQSLYRVMLVSEDEQYAAMLRRAGIDVVRTHKPSELFNLSATYQPELILVAATLQDCNGIDLIRLIRQNACFLDIPVICIGDQSDETLHLPALIAGADDFLPGTIDATHFGVTVAGRAERYRALRRLIMHDSLTGLYNHAAIKEYLAREMMHIERHAVPLSMAMIDLDFFKKVNDTYGHPAGDQVIRSLARLLQQRLRRGDIIGRYGGEEFVIVMPATTLDAAIAVVVDICAAFAQVRQSADGVEFYSTLSAGVAEASGHASAASLLRSADAALYQAKHAGRNCVIAASPP